MASYDVFFKNKWQIQNAWPTSRVPAVLSPSISAPGSTEVEATLDAAVEDPKLERSTSSLPSKTTDRPSLLKMYSTSLRPGTFFPGTACFDRAEECLVTSIKNESGLAVIDALMGSVLSFYRRSAAGRPAGAQLWLSEGWIVYATGHKELLVCRFERLIKPIQEPRRGFLHKFSIIQSPDGANFRACRFHFPTLVATTDDYHCLVYDVPRKVLAHDIVLKGLPLSLLPEVSFPSVDFDEEYIFVLFNCHAKSDKGEASVTGFLQIYSRNNGNCLWTCPASTLLSISSTLCLESPHKVSPWGNCDGSHWCLLPTRDASPAHQQNATKSSGLYAVRYDKHTASLLLRGGQGIFIIHYKPKCRAALASGPSDRPDTDTSTTAVYIQVGPRRDFADRLAAYDGRVAFVVATALVIVDIDIAVTIAQTGAGLYGRSAAYVHRLSDLRFGELSSLQMDATSLTAVGSFNGILIPNGIRRPSHPPAGQPSEGTEAPVGVEQTDNASWEQELADDDEVLQPLDKVLVFDFGQLARKLRSVSARALTDERAKKTVLCYPSGQTLSRLQRSGHMVMDPYGMFEAYEELSTDEDELFAIMDENLWRVWGAHGPGCTCGG